MPLHVVGLAELAVRSAPEDTLVTYALGSCIALIAWDPRAKVGGMLHYMLPQSSCCPERARERPAMFGDLGIPLLLEAVAREGGRARGLVLKAAGGATRFDDGGTFDIGARNHTMLRKMLWRAGLALAAEDVGGTRSRTVRLQVASGEVTVRSEGREWTL